MGANLGDNPGGGDPGGGNPGGGKVRYKHTYIYIYEAGTFRVYASIASY